MKELIKKFIPHFLLSFYHYFLAQAAKYFYGNPSEKLLIVGVTGTAGKSTTCYFTLQMLNQNHIKTGMTSTTIFNDGQKEWLNDKKMTMLGRFQTQKIMADMVKNGCQAAVIETSSQGIEQYRHAGINYDILVFTNLYPEHIEAHGNFENYKRAKGKLFDSLKHKKTKILKQFGQIKKTIIVNLDDKQANYFLNFPADRKIGYTRNQKSTVEAGQTEIRNQVNEIVYYNNNWQNKLLGEYNKDNLLAATCVAQVVGISQEQSAKTIINLKLLPGRLEFIENNLGATIIVDYSFEPVAITRLYETIQNLPYNKIIHVLGSTGGGRDKARRPLLGKLAAEKADVIIVTNEDPYDDDPKKIIGEVVNGAMGDNFQFPFSNFQKILKFQISNSQKVVWAILERREAMAQALKLAEKDAIILITGKGAEQAICVAGGKKIKWDDRVVVREELHKLSK